MSVSAQELVNKLRVFVHRSFLVTQCCSSSNARTPKQELVRFFLEQTWYDQVANEDLKTAVTFVFKTLEGLSKGTCLLLLLLLLYILIIIIPKVNLVFLFD